MSPYPDASDVPARILIVDDVRENRTLLQVMLSAQGYLLEEAGSGEEALARVAARPPDLILLDVMMPGIDGHQVAAKIKGDPATKNILIVMVTAANDRSAKILGLSAGAEDFLSKPVDRAELYMRVRNLLRLKAFGDYHDKYGKLLEGEVGSRTADLIESERLFRSTFDQAPVGIVHVALDGRWLRVNQHICDLLGYSRDELQSASGRALAQAEDTTDEAESLRQVLAGTLARHVIDEKRYRRGDGGFILARVTTSIHRDAHQEPQHFISVIEDITEQKRAAVQARNDERKFRRFVETSHDGICILDARSRFTFVNRRMETMFGYEPGELIGSSSLDLLPEDARHVGQAIIDRRDRALVETGEYLLRRKDGSTLWAVRSAFPIVGDDGVHEGTYAIVMDISERKRSEEALRKSAEQLRQAQKMEALGGLAGGVAHDFNNLLSVILSYSELLALDLKEGDPMRADLEEIRGAGLRAAELTRQLLAFSRQQALRPEVVDLYAIVAGLEKMLRRLIGEDIELSTTSSSGRGRVLVDPGQMEQVIMNLVVNARDAMPRGGKLTVEAAEVLLDDAYAAHHAGVTPGPHVLLAVSDTGTGMDAATQARIFEPFFTTKEVGKGTGLGLATVFGIVQQSGGSLGVYSELGKGTTFKVYFPRVDGAVANASSPPPSLRTVHGSETILLVEDDERVRILACAILRKYGYNVLEAHSGGDAFLLCEQHGATIHLLLTDVVMPRMSGRQLAERLLAVRPGMKVLYMSGYTDDAVVRHGILDSTVAFLQKPITPEVLARKVREVLDSALQAVIP